MSALVAARHNPDRKAKYQQLADAVKPSKIAITAVMREHVVTASALLKADQFWQKPRLDHQEYTKFRSRTPALEA